MTLIRHHVKYKAIHGVDEIVLMDRGEHRRHHNALKHAGLNDVPFKICKLKRVTYDRLKKYGFAGESIDTAMSRVLDAMDKKMIEARSTRADK